MLLDRLNSRNTTFGTDLGETRGKTIGEFSNQEWDKLLEKVDNCIDEYKEDLREREEEALEKQKEQAEQYICRQKNDSDLEFEQNVMIGSTLQSMRFFKLNDAMFSAEQEETEKPDAMDSIEDFISQEAIEKLVTEKIVGDREKIPYSILADENGMIEYHGTVFVGDADTNSLCLGDMSNPDNVLTIELSDGGHLKVNVDSFEDLEKAIGMFSPKDRTRIMRAIAQYNRIKQIQQQIEDETSGLQVLEKKETT